jgi:branched-chain amino acid transport system ATP-binding protein
MLLKIENLSVNYGYISALAKINLEVNQGEIVTLIGGNGAGKTTTLMAISNLVDKAEGTITFKGADITRMGPDKIVKMGISHIPEGRKIFPGLSVYENLIAGTMGNPALTKADIEQNLEATYQMFPRLKERIGQSGGSLSGGEQQMLAIARGLMMNPGLLMLDEPSLGLAPILVEDIFERIIRIRETGKTILLIEQNASMALSVADKGYVIETGKVKLEGSGKSLLNNPEVKKAYLGG